MLTFLLLICAALANPSWRDMPRSTKEERIAKRAARLEWQKSRLANACAFVPIEQCTDETFEACKTEVDPEFDPKRYANPKKEGWYAKVKFNGAESFHFIEQTTGDVCCHKGKLRKMSRRYVKEQGVEDEAIEGCGQLYEDSEDQLGHLNRRKHFVSFCAFIRSDPTVEELFEMGMDSVCPKMVDQLELDTDEKLVTFFADKWNTPAMTKEERVARRQARQAKKQGRRRNRKQRQ